MNAPFLIRKDDKPEIKHARVPPTWARILRRLMSLQPGRYQITLTVQDEMVDWSVLPLGHVEK